MQQTHNDWLMTMHRSQGGYALGDPGVLLLYVDGTLCMQSQHRAELCSEMEC